MERNKSKYRKILEGLVVGSFVELRFKDLREYYIEYGRIGGVISRYKRVSGRIFKRSHKRGSVILRITRMV